MRVLSYIRNNGELKPVEVELSLSPGLPQILFLGLPDTALRESALRIRSALRAQGFQFPQAQQVLVHLKPTHLRKSSRGLDLAVVGALLWETGQIPMPELESDEMPILYGEITLKGEVVVPDDIDEIDPGEEKILWTGPTQMPLSFNTLQVDDLRKLNEPIRVSNTQTGTNWKRPECKTSSFPKEAAELAMVVSAGEHSLLLAGPPGSGKSTLADSIPCWIQPPEQQEYKLAKRFARRVGREIDWRPVSRPHHSITPMAMIGGGNSAWSGEISRAHGGVLIMDELLEFHADIQEAMREPVETGSISIVRGGAAKLYPARILLLATTNLCSCGKFVPKRDSAACRCSKNQRRRVLSRLNGPFSDRFAIFALTDEWKSKKSKEVITSSEVEERVGRAIDFRVRSRGQHQPNARVKPESFELGLKSFCLARLEDALWDQSRRRRDAVVRVARSLADLRCDPEISMADLESSIRLCLRTHRLLEEWQD